MPTPTRPYLFYDTAVSICSTCYRRVDAKIVFQEGCVYMLKRCPRHGPERVLIADDVDYYRRCREVFLKVPEQPCRNNTAVEHGCPYDCGLCPDHEQHSCLTLLEVTDHCNLRCPVCYAESGPERGGMRDLATLERMLDAIVANEGEPDVVQLSGGEPTLHPQFFEILDACRRRPIRHFMVNTNGLRIAQDRAFAERLASYQPAFELYLQFDSLEAAPLLELRGADLRATRLKALETLNEQLTRWIETYHGSVHGSTKEKPLARYLAHIHLVREAPKDLNDYFRIRTVRKVDKDRTVSLAGRLWEAPVALMGKMVTLRYHAADPARIEVFFDNTSYGMLVPLDLGINCRIRRHKVLDLLPEQKTPETIYEGGRLWEARDE